MKEIAVLFVGVLIISIGVFLYATPYITLHSESSDETVPANVRTEISWHFEEGERIEGYFTVRGGNEEIDFYIKDSYGAIIYSAGTVKGRHDFALTAERAGLCSLEFDNVINPTSKVIYLTYEITARNILSDLLSLPMLLFGICLSVIGGLSIYQSKMKEKVKT